MTADGEEIVTFRLAPRDRSAIQRLVDGGEFHNRSDFLRYAVKTTLRDFERGAPKLDLEIEGVDIAQDAPRARGRIGRGKRGMSR